MNIRQITGSVRYGLEHPLSDAVDARKFLCNAHGVTAKGREKKVSGGQRGGAAGRPIPQSLGAAHTRLAFVPV
jgi:hypothetical protein